MVALFFLVKVHVIIQHEHNCLKALKKMHVAIQIAGCNQGQCYGLFLTGPFKTQNEYHD